MIKFQKRWHDFLQSLIFKIINIIFEQRQKSFIKSLTLFILLIKRNF